MAYNNDQWQEAIVNIANVGLGTAVATGSAVPASADYIGWNSGGNLVGVSATNPLPVAAQHASMIDVTNGSTTPLGGNASFTGTAQSSLPYSALSVEVFADQAGTLIVEQSQDGTNWDTQDSFSVTASTNFQTTVNLIGSKYRIVYNNGSNAQGTFRLQTVAQTQDVTLPRTLTALGNSKTAIQEVNGVVAGNQDNIVVLASAARTTTQTQSDQTNTNCKGIIVVLDMTNVGTGSVTLEIDAKDPVSGKYYAILTGAAVTTNSTNIYRVYPGLTAVANATASDVLPKTWRIKVTANNANSATYSVGAMLIV
jgi:hypothetical protein